MRLRLNAPDVMQETVDGEVIIVNVATGIYYSLAGAGAAIWSDLLQGCDETTIAGRIAALGGATLDVVAGEVSRFIAELRAENLLVPAGDAPDAQDAAAPAAPAGSDPAAAPFTEGLCPFVPPTLARYSDMEELLLVDPIHEVQPAGWPLKPGGSN